MKAKKTKLDSEQEEQPKKQSADVNLESKAVYSFNSLEGQESNTLVYRDDPNFQDILLRFQSAESVPAQLRLLVPAGQAVTIGFFVPRDYAQACAGIGYNRGAAAADWNDRLHLFGSVDLCRNSLEGAGAQATFGLTTPLFGPDRLRLGIEYADDTGATATRTLGIGLTYRYYFAP